MENKDAEEFFNNPDDHIPGSNSNPEREEDGSLPDGFDAQLSQEWTNLAQPAPAQRRNESLKEFRDNEKVGSPGWSETQFLKTSPELVM